MQSTTLILTIALSALALAFVVVSVLRNLGRPLFRSVAALVAVLVSIPIALLPAIAFSRAMASGLISAFDPALLEKIQSVVPTAEAAIRGLMQLLLAPILFVFLYLLIRLIVSWILGAIARYLETKYPEAGRARKPIGAALGAICGLALVVIYLMPLASYTGVLAHAEELDLPELAEGMSEEDVEAIHTFANTPVLAISRALGGDGLFALLTRTQIGDETVSMSREVDVLAELVVAIVPLTQKDLSGWSEAETAVITGTLPDAMDASALLRTLGAEALSELSDAWLRGEDFLSMEKPAMSGAKGAFLDSVLASLRDTTTDTVADDIRGMAPVVSLALKVYGTDGTDAAGLVELLRDDLEDPTVKSVVMTAGVQMVADQLGMYNNKEAIYMDYSTALAQLSGETDAQTLCAQIGALNEQYAVDMSDADVSVLAACMAANPYAAPSQAACGETAVSPISSSGRLDYSFDLLYTYMAVAMTDEDVLRWMEQIALAAEGDAAALGWLSDQSGIPSALITKDALTELVANAEVLSALNGEQMESLITSAADLATAGNTLTLEKAVSVMSGTLQVLAQTEAGKTFADTLVMGVLQSETARAATGMSAAQATAVATAIQESGSYENLEQTATDITNLVDALGNLGAGSGMDSITSERFYTLVSTMNDSTVALLQTLCEPSMLQSFGVNAKGAPAVAHLLHDLLNRMVELRPTWTEEQCRAEADALYRLVALATDTRDPNGETFEERLGMPAASLADALLDSQLLGDVLPASVSEMPELRITLHEEDRAELTEALQTKPGDHSTAFVEALLKIIGQ